MKRYDEVMNNIDSVNEITTEVLSNNNDTDTMTQMIMASILENITQISVTLAVICDHLKGE